MKKRLLALTTTLIVIGLTTTLAIALGAWSKFSDPTNEISVMLPGAVTAKTTAAGGAQYEGSDGNASYIVSFRHRSPHPEAEEVQLFCGTFPKAFAKIMGDKGDYIILSAPSDVAGKGWRGRTFRYTDATGRQGAFEIAVSDRHNFVLHVFGKANIDEGANRFFSSFEVN